MGIDLYGLSRVVGEKGVLPQRARKLDPSLPCREAELLIDVESLNIDAASFKQIKDDVGGDPARIAARIQEIVRERGKMQNPVTGSGGMFIGRVKEMGPEHPARGTLKPGDRIATLVSLTLTPLVIEEVQGGARGHRPRRHPRPRDPVRQRHLREAAVGHAGHAGAGGAGRVRARPRWWRAT